MSADAEQIDLVERLEAAVAAREAADANVLDLLARGRAMRPPIPLAVLAKAAGVGESAVSVRLARHGRR